MSDDASPKWKQGDLEPNRDHRCRTCEHWGAPFFDKPKGRWNCTCPLPFWVLRVADTGPGEGKDCEAYSHSYRQARLVR